MVTFSEYVITITAVTFGGLFSIRCCNCLQAEKNNRIQSEYQIYARIMDARIRLQGNEVFSKMAKENPLYAERFALVDTPDEYYIIVAFIDLFEFIFHLYKTEE
jgi:hypothetical protein